jgi:hypothetical protein
MANGNFVVQNGLQIGPLTIDAATGGITTSGNIITTGTTTTFINEVVTGTEAVYGRLTANSNVASTSTTTGAFQVWGGVGLTGDLFVGGNVHQTGTAYSKIPAGTSAQRPGSPSLGMIRYNSDISSYEGYGAGSAWSSLGGVKSVDGYATITAEASAGAGDDVLRFYSGSTGSQVQVAWASAGNVSILPATAATSTTTGALQVTGGISTQNNLYVAGTASVTGHVTVEGVTSTGATGTGKFVFDGSPTLVTPTLGVASATTINKVTISAPATGSTLTIADGKTLTASNTLTFTGTDSSSVAFGAGGTVVYTSNKLSALSATTSSELAGVISDETGTGSLVFANSPTLVTPTLGAATATSINGLTVSTSTGTLTVANGKTLTASNTLTFTGTDSSSVAFGAGGTVAYTSNKLSAFAATTSAELAGVLSDETGTGSVVFSASPTLTGTLTVADVSSSGNIATTSTVDSTSTSTGSIKTSGGVGIAKNLYVGGTATITGNVTIGGNLTVTGNSVSIGASTLSIQDNIINLNTPSDLTALTVPTTTDIGVKVHYYDSVDSAAFFGRANDTGFFEWYSRGTDAGNVFTGTAYGTIKTGELVLANTTASTSTTTGAARISGGLGVAGAIYAGSLQATPIGATTASTGAFTTLTNSGVHTSNGNLVAASGTTSSSTTTGALVVVGGAGVSGAVYAGSLYDNGTRVVSTSSGAGNLSISGTGINLPATGPGAASVGSSTAIPVITTDAYGRVSATSTAAVVAPAGTLTGATLASNVTASSLTSVGTLTGLTVSGAIVPNANVTVNLGSTSAWFNNIYGVATQAK